MPAPVQGLHHLTGVCNEWERTTTFYEALGFRLVKNTVNHDDPQSRHIYLSNARGDPGTTITFFEWPSGRRGVPGLRSAQHVGLSLPRGRTLSDVQEELEPFDVLVQPLEDRFGPCLEARDPDGLRLRLYEGDDPGPSLHHAALQGMLEERQRFFDQTLGLEVQHQEGEGPVTVLDPQRRPVLMLMPGSPGPGRVAPGAIHHIALSAIDADHQKQLREHLQEQGSPPTAVIDRLYFKSIYLKDPAGHVLEVATPGPGFTADEEVEELGQRLVLPPWLEGQRSQIEQALERKAEKAAEAR